jgi:nitrogenase iron protein NifH
LAPASACDHRERPNSQQGAKQVNNIGIPHNGKSVGLKQIAVYGKGGIGKSTISANVSSAMALGGSRVLQIGCDPKQDSTRLLLEGRRVMTVLDYLRATSPNDRTLDSIVHIGFAGVACVEAGGPEPGVGCAGRGILSALDLLESLGIGAYRYDIVLYDVLGDVVCGGFAVPLREQYADFIYIVTSGEFMSLYAANNILRGVRNFEERGLKMAGVILNGRGLADEDDRVKRFADAVRLPVVASFPRSREINAAEQLGLTVVQAFPGDAMAVQFAKLAEDILRFESPMPALPLPVDDLESVVLSGAAHRSFPLPMPRSSKQGGKLLPDQTLSPPLAQPRRYRSKSVNRHEVLHGCAFNGAAHTLMQIKDAITIAHGPRSCAYISSHGMVSAAKRAMNRYGAPQESLFVSVLQSTEMDERVVIFGGNDSLENGLRRAAEEDPKAIFVVTTCSSGIIGDDVHVAMEGARDALGENVSVIPVTADGDINGDYMQGIIDAMIAVADRYVDRTFTPEQDVVNIVGEKNLATNTEESYRTVRSMLDTLGLRVNCRFIRNCTTEQLARFLLGRINLLASADLCGRTIRDYLTDRYGVSFLSSPFPVGFNATERWLTELAAVFGKEAEAADLLRRERIRYEAAMEPVRSSLQGKRLFIVTQSYQIDWVLDLAFDLGMEIIKVGVLASSWDEEFITRYGERFPLALSYTRAERDADIRSLSPDLTLTNAVWQGQPEDMRADAIPIIPDVGFESGVAIAQRWQRLMKLPPKEGWRHDV